jgi:hypothetical protein
VLGPIMVFTEAWIETWKDNFLLCGFFFVYCTMGWPLTCDRVLIRGRVPSNQKR